MINDKIIELSETVEAVSESRKTYETPKVTVNASDMDDVIMISREPGETPFVPTRF